MTYSELQAAIADWCQRSDLSSVIPTWVRFASARFNRTLRVPQMEARDFATITSEYITLPADFLEIISVKDSANRELRYLARQQFSALVAQNSRVDVPIFCVEDYQLRIWPAPSPSAPLTVTILYYEELAPLVNGPDTNWLLTDYPDVYLYGALMHGRAWMHDDARLANVKALYDEGIAEVQRSKVAATGISSAVGTDIPPFVGVFDIARGYT